jgi:peroxiredoxin Q/BCP
MPEVGKAAPAFKLKNQDGKVISLSDFKGKDVVLYFYPKDDTPGCTTEACSFRDELPRFNGVNAVILGVSPDSVDSHKKFSQKYELPFDILSDESKEVVQKYDVWKEKNNYGKKYMGVVRSTFIIDKNGKIKKIFNNVKVNGHSEEVMKALQE